MQKYPKDSKRIQKNPKEGHSPPPPPNPPKEPKN